MYDCCSFQKIARFSRLAVVGSGLPQAPGGVLHWRVLMVFILIGGATVGGKIGVGKHAGWHVLNGNFERSGPRQWHRVYHNENLVYPSRFRGMAGRKLPSTRYSTSFSCSLRFYIRFSATTLPPYDPPWKALHISRPRLPYSLNASLPTLRVETFKFQFNAASFVGEVSRTRQVFLLSFLVRNSGYCSLTRLHIGHSVTRPASQVFIILKTLLTFGKDGCCIWRQWQINPCKGLWLYLVLCSLIWLP